MKKYIAGLLVTGSLLSMMAFGAVNTAHAQTIDMGQFRMLVQLLIAIGAIPPEKADIARKIVGLTPVSTTTESTTIAPVPTQTSPVNQTVVQPSGVIVNPVNMPTISLGDGYKNAGGSYIIPVVISAGSYNNVIFSATNSQSRSSVRFTFNPTSYQAAHNGLDLINFDPPFTNQAGDYAWTASVYDGSGNVITNSSGTFAVPQQ